MSVFDTIAYFDDDVDHLVDDKSEDPGQAQPTPYRPHHQGGDHQEETKGDLAERERERGGEGREKGREGGRKGGNEI